MAKRQDIELLLRVVTQFVEKQLTPAGILPFGATLGSTRDVQLLLPKTIKPDAQMHELDAYWRQELAKPIAAGGCKAVCYCVDLRVKASGEGTQSTVVFIHIEDSEGCAEDVLYDYQFANDLKVILGDPYVEKSDQRLFSS
jgi:hypothetical protein